MLNVIFCNVNVDQNIFPTMFLSIGLGVSFTIPFFSMDKTFEIRFDGTFHYIGILGRM